MTHFVHIWRYNYYFWFFTQVFLAANFFVNLVCVLITAFAVNWLPIMWLLSRPHSFLPKPPIASRDPVVNYSMLRFTGTLSGPRAALCLSHVHFFTMMNCRAVSLEDYRTMTGRCTFESDRARLDAGVAQSAVLPQASWKFRWSHSFWGLGTASLSIP